MHVLDTDTLTHLHAGHPRVIKQLQEVDDPDICTTIVYYDQSGFEIQPLSPLF